MTGRPPVTDWATDFDFLDPQWVDDPYPIWDALRTKCPIAHTDRYHGVYLPTKAADIRTIAYDTEHFSSRVVAVREQFPPDRGGGPPITSDPPRHRPARMALLPSFTRAAVAKLEPMTRAYCRELVEAFADKGRCDAALDYAQHIPIKVIAHMLGIPDADGEKFRNWVHIVFQASITDESAMHAALAEMTEYFRGHLPARRACPGDDLMSVLLASTYPDGQLFTENHVLGSLRTVLLAGGDTTWSGIGAAIWHLATHDNDRRRIAGNPALIAPAIEEFLRAYAPVTMAREIAKETTVNGCVFRRGQFVLMAYPSANRDPDMFADADKVIIDRPDNRHAAFGFGIHRCLGEHLARMNMLVAIDVLLKRIPEFRLDGAVVWSAGTVRGPRSLPITF